MRHLGLFNDFDYRLIAIIRVISFVSSNVIILSNSFT